MKYNYKKIDAFTSEASLGNPAACIYLENNQSLSDKEMLEIAERHKGFVTEVVYCQTINGGQYKLTYFSSECEVDFCGHGTIACMFALIKSSPELLNKKEITISTNKKGSFHIYNDIISQNSIYINAPKPAYFDNYSSKEEIAENLGISVNKISLKLPTEIIDAGLKTLIVPIEKYQDEINIFPDEKRLKKFCINNSIDIILIFSLEVQDKNNIAHTRVFAPKFGYLEDPATGSGNSAFGYYMLKNKIWNGENISVEQGGRDRIFNIIKLAFKNNLVRFGGEASVRIEGYYFN